MGQGPRSVTDADCAETCPMRCFLHLLPILGSLGYFAPVASAASPTTPRELVRADAATLDALYATGSVGDIPAGFLPGRVIVDPGSRGAVAKSRRLGLLWQ